MAFIVTENIKKPFTATNKAMRTSIEEIIDEITIDVIDRDGKRSEKGAFRIDFTPASGGSMLVQMQAGSATFASATYSLALIDAIAANFEAFKEALKEVLMTCQRTGKNTIITWA